MRAADIQMRHMSDTHTGPVNLQRQVGSLYGRVQSCFLQYGVQCHPWFPPEQARTWDALQILARWQRSSLEPLAELLEGRRWPNEPGRFPAASAGLNDVSLEYFREKITEDQKQLVAQIASVRGSIPKDTDVSVCLNRLLAEQRLILVELWSLADHDHEASKHKELAAAPMSQLRLSEKLSSGARTTPVQVSV